MTWRKVTISTFLNERKGRYKPDEAMRMKLKRIDKIDFSNNIHLSETTETKTDMILVKQGDLVISGINAEKGAIAIYRGEEDIMATIHYSSYTYNEKEIDIDYLKWFLKSETFLNTLKEQTKGGIKTELKPNRLLPLEIYLPDKPMQKQILKKLNNIEEEVLELEENIDGTANLLVKLRQSILQDAVKGKLVKQNPKDEPATELLKRIKAKKEKLIKQGKIKKEKPLPPITAEEIPYELPKGWAWCRLGEVAEINPSNSIDDNLDVSFIPMALVKQEYGVWPDSEKRKWKEIKKGYTHFQDNDVVVAKITPCFENSKAGVMNNLINGYGAGTTELYVLRILKKLTDSNYLYCFVKTSKFLKEGEGVMTGTAGQKRVPREYIENCLFPLPPLAEQNRIVEKVNELMDLCSSLEKEIAHSKQEADYLLNAILRGCRLMSNRGSG